MEEQALTQKSCSKQDQCSSSEATILTVSAKKEKGCQLPLVRHNTQNTPSSGKKEFFSQDSFVMKNNLPQQGRWAESEH